MLLIVMGFESLATAGLEPMCFRVEGDCGFPCTWAVLINPVNPIASSCHPKHMG